MSPCMYACPTCLASRVRVMLRTRLGKVLIVDDDPLLLSRIERVLSRAGLEVRCALGGDEALALVRSESFARAIVDYHPVRMDGRVVLEELRQLQPECGRILLSGCLDLAVVMAVVNSCQIHRVMQKPFVK